MTIELRIEGEETGELAREAEELLAYLAGSPPEKRKIQPHEKIHRGDPVAIATLILTIPGALVATLDLIERAKIAKRVAKLKRKALSFPGNITVKNDETVADLKATEEDEIINILIQR